MFTPGKRNMKPRLLSRRTGCTLCLLVSLQDGVGYDLNLPNIHGLVLTGIQMQMITNTRLQQVLLGPGQHGRIVKKTHTSQTPGGKSRSIMTNSNDSSCACGNQHARITNNICPPHWRYGYVRILHLEQLNLVIFPIYTNHVLGTWVTDGFQATLCLPRIFPHTLYSLSIPC